MKIRVCVGSTVCRNQKLCLVEVWCVDGGQLDLHRPISEPGDLPHRRSGNTASVLRLLQHTHPGAGAAALMQVLHLFLQFFFLLAFLHGRFIICRCLPLFKGDGSCGAARQTITKTVAEILPHQLCLAVNDVNRALMARSCAQTAAVALVLVNMNDFADHIFTSRFASFCFCNTIIV